MNTTQPTKERGGSDPAGFDAIVREVFAPIYPVIAGQIVERTGLRSGKCLDAGCGTGALGRAIAGRTDLHVTFFDRSEAMLSYARRHVEAESLSSRSHFVEGDIHAIDLASESMDLVISRGSSPFWENREQAYSEILRVLRKGGKAYIGGGFGNAGLREYITQTMQKRNPDWRKNFKDRVIAEREALPGMLERLNPASFTIINDESGYWALICK